MVDTACMALDELVRTAQMSDDVDFLRAVMHMLAQPLMEVEVVTPTLACDGKSLQFGIHSAALAQLRRSLGAGCRFGSEHAVKLLHESARV